MKLSKLRSAIEWKLKTTAVVSLLVGILVPVSGAYAGQRFSTVKVDSSALASPTTSNLVRELNASLGAELRANFAGDLGGGRKAPLLLVRITGVTMNSTPDFRNGAGHANSGGGGSDYMEGEALIIAPGGQVIQRYPMLSALNTSSSGWQLPDHERNRLRALCQHYAWWLKRQMP